MHGDYRLVVQTREFSTARGGLKRDDLHMRERVLHLFQNGMNVRIICLGVYMMGMRQ
jgi:hypothetical protein